MRIRNWLLVLGGLCFVPPSQALELADIPVREFTPARGEIIEIPFTLERAATVEVRIVSSDGDLVRVLQADSPLEPGRHAVSWDGRDDEGMVVPDEAYVIVAQAEEPGGKRLVVDSRTTSGGETLRDLQTRVTASGDIEYVLPQPARVLIRVGIQGGAMVASLADWAPRVAGKNVQRWNGYDSDGIDRLLENPRMRAVVGAFALPRDIVITTGNSGLDYLTYRRQKQWPNETVALEKVSLVRGEQALSPHFFMPRDYDRNPRVELDFASGVERTEDGVAVLNGPAIVRVDVPEEDRWLLQRSLYEVSFFIDYDFVSEEENGYVPLSWRLDPASLDPGRHVLTVNVAGFLGQVGVKSLPFVVRRN